MGFIKTTTIPGPQVRHVLPSDCSSSSNASQTSDSESGSFWNTTTKKTKDQMLMFKFLSVDVEFKAEINNEFRIILHTIQ